MRQIRIAAMARNVKKLTIRPSSPAVIHVEPGSVMCPEAHQWGRHAFKVYCC